MKVFSKKVLRTFQAFGQKGGMKRAKSLSPTQRQAIAKRAAFVRWGKKSTKTPPMASVRLNKSPWHDPVFIDEVLTYGGLKEWRELRTIVADHPFGVESIALETVLKSTEIYGATLLWKAALHRVRGTHS